MANSVGNLFTKYSATYSKAGEEDAGRVPLNPKELKKASRNELRGLEGDALRISKRGGNFLDRVMCWIEDRVFSLTRSDHPDSRRQSQSKEFSEDVKNALTEIGVDTEGVDEHQLMKQIKSVQVRDLPLRSGFVQSILRGVASLENGSGKDRLPEIAKAAFSETDTGSPAQALVYQDALPERDPEPEQVVTNTSDNGHDKSGHQTPVHGDESVRNDPKLSSETVGETHKADGKKLADLTSAEFTERLCQQTKGIFSIHLDAELRTSGRNITQEQREEIVRGATLELASLRFPSDEGHDPISGTMAYAKECEEARHEESKGRGRNLSAAKIQEKVFVDLELKIGDHDRFKAYVSARLDELEGVESIGIDQPDSAAKKAATEAFTEKLEKRRYGACSVQAAAFRVIREAGPDLDANSSDKATKEHLYGETWQRHKQTATQIFSKHYDSAAEKSSDIPFKEIDKATMEDFIPLFRQEFEGVVKKLVDKV